MLKTKYFLIIFALLIVLTACQPTPENNIVVGKNDGKLEEIIEDTQTNEVKIDEVIKEKTWEDTFSTKDNVVIFEIAANVCLPNVDTFPVAYISPKNISQDMADKVLNTLIGENILYEESDVLTKGEIEREIANIEYAIDNEYQQYKDSDPEEYKYLINKSTSRLEELYILYKSAPEVPSKIASREFSIPNGFEYEGENAPLIENGTLTQEQVESIENEQFTVEQVIKGEADLGKEELARIEIFKYSTVNQGIWFKNGQVNRKIIFESTVDGVTKEQANDTAKDVLANMGIEGFDVYQTGYSRVWCDTAEEEQYAYKFLFKRVVNGVSVSHVEEYKYTTGSQQFREPWKPESIWITIDKTGLLEFEYSQPIEIDEIANDNVAILSFNDVQEIFKKQMQISYAWNDDQHIISQTVTINWIELGLAMIARKNNEGYMLVPAWNFYGFETYTYDEQQPGGWQLDENNQVILDEYATSFLTINAIDGSLIDNKLSY